MQGTSCPGVATQLGGTRQMYNFNARGAMVLEEENNTNSLNN